LLNQRKAKARKGSGFINCLADSYEPGAKYGFPFINGKDATAIILGDVP